MTLGEIMVHSWITEGGTYPLSVLCQHHHLVGLQG